MESSVQQYVKSNSRDEVFKKMMEVIDEDRKIYNYNKDNIQSYALATQPHFLVWLNSLVLKNVGGEVLRENAYEEMFGLGKEGNHSILCLKYFEQLGDYKIEHYKRGKVASEIVYKYIDRPTVVLSYLIATELAVGFLDDLEKTIEKIGGIYDYTYIEVHKDADNVDNEDGHGIKLLNILEEENSIVEDINIGIQVYRDFYFELFRN